MAAQKYRALVGLNYPGKDGTEVRVEPGDVVTDIPEKSVKWLLEQGAIEKVTGKE